MSTEVIKDLKGPGVLGTMARTDPSEDMFLQNINLLNKDQDQVPPAEKQVPPPPPDGEDDERDTSTLDRLKELLSQKPEDMTGISQAVAGLQALTVGENIRTGRTPLSQMGAQIGEVGQSFAAVDKAKRNLIKDEIASLATLAGLEQNEAKMKAAADENRLNRIFNYHKLDIETQLGVMKAIAGETGASQLLITDPEAYFDAVDKLSAQISGKETLQTKGEVMGESKTGQKLIKVNQGLLNPQLQTKLPGQP